MMPLIMRYLVSEILSCVSDCASSGEYSLGHVCRIRQSNMTLTLLGCLGSSAILTQLLYIRP